jgi:hypothetical protein
MTAHLSVMGAMSVVTKAIKIRAENWFWVSRGSDMDLEAINLLLRFITMVATTSSTAPRPFIPKPTMADAQRGSDPIRIR